MGKQKITVEILEASAAATLPNFGLNRQPLFLHSTNKMDG